MFISSTDNKIFKRTLTQSENPHILIDPALVINDEYTASFGFEWTKIDGFVGKEVLSHGHLFGRFLLPSNYMNGKIIADVGCGNGRIGRLIAPTAGKYIGLDMSVAIEAFPTYIENFNNVTLIRASATDLPLENNSVDISICWGVLHHTDMPEKALSELVRITKPGGNILIFVYSPQYESRRNFNQLVREIPPMETFDLVEKTSDEIDAWCEVDEFFGGIVANHLHLGRKQSREWQIFQWYDGISPRYHWSLTPMLSAITSLKAEVSDPARGIFKFIKL